MPIDASIYSQVGKPTVELENPQNAMLRAAQLQNAQNQNKLFSMQAQDAEEARAGKNALANAYKTAYDPVTGQVDRTKLTTGLAQSNQGAQIPGLQKTFNEQDKAQREADKAKLESVKQHIDLQGQLLGGVKDQNSWTQALQIAQQNGIDVSKFPQQYDPATVQQLRQRALSAKDQADQEWKQKGYDLDVRRTNIAGEHLGIAREANKIKREEATAGGKPPSGYRFKPDGTLEAIPGGPGDKLPEAQQKQVVGTQNLSSAISEYRKELKNFGALDSLKPDQRAAMGTKYNNMMLQAKEAYNLGVLNGPDLDILTAVITDPRSIKGVITSKSALDKQASELDRIMGGIASTSGNPRPQDAGRKPLSNGGGQNIDALLDKYK